MTLSTLEGRRVSYRNRVAVLERESRSEFGPANNEKAFRSVTDTHCHALTDLTERWQSGLITKRELLVQAQSIIDHANK